MSAKPQPKLMTVAEYLAHERRAEFKSDFIDGRLYPLHNPYGPADPSAMAGATREHNRVKENLVVHLGGRLPAVRPRRSPATSGCGCRRRAGTTTRTS